MRPIKSKVDVESTKEAGRNTEEMVKTATVESLKNVSNSINLSGLMSMASVSC